MRKKDRVIKSPIPWVIFFYLISYLLGSIPALVILNQKPSIEDTVFDGIEKRAREILNQDARSFNKIEYIGIENNVLLVGVSSLESTYNVHLFKYNFQSTYNEKNIYDHIAKQGLKNIAFTNDIFARLICDDEIKVPIELNGVEHITKNQICYANEYEQRIRLECGTLDEMVYTFMYDEQNEQTIVFNYFSNEYGEVVSNIW